MFMKSVQAACGIAAVLLCLSGCGGAGTDASTSTAAASSASATSSATSTSSTSSSSTSATSSPPTSTTGSATLSWTAPTANSNGSALTDLAGYHIHYGTTAGSLTQTVDVSNASELSYTVTGLTAGTWYFAVTAYTTSGLESSPSNVGSKTIT